MFGELQPALAEQSPGDWLLSGGQSSLIARNWSNHHAKRSERPRHLKR
jgi:hypothetical protein